VPAEKVAQVITAPCITVAGATAAEISAQERAILNHAELRENVLAARAEIYLSRARNISKY
jgi:hypothetical protein